jgi:hypothetical protein
MISGYATGVFPPFPQFCCVTVKDMQATVSVWQFVAPPCGFHTLFSTRKVVIPLDVVTFPVFAVIVLVEAHPELPELVEVALEVVWELVVEVLGVVLVELTTVLVAVTKLVLVGVTVLVMPVAGVVVVDTVGMPEVLVASPPDVLPVGTVEVAPPEPVDPPVSHAAAATTKPRPTPRAPVIQRSI